MSAVVEITSEADARDLARRLVGREHDLPIVLVTGGACRRERWIDPEAVREGVGRYAEVVWMPTGDVT